MICDAISGLVSGDWRLVCDPSSVPMQLAFWLSVLVCAAMVVWGLFGGAIAGAQRAVGLRRGLTVALTCAAALLAAFATSNPRLERPTEAEVSLLVIVQDASESVMRNGSGLAAVRAELAQLVQAQTVDPEVAQAWRGAVVQFGSIARIEVTDLPLSALVATLGTELAGNGQGDSQLALGLEQARDAIDAVGGRGAIWVIGDGHWDPAGLQEEMQQLTARGIAVFVRPIGSDAPSLGLVSADIGPLQTLGAMAPVRMVVAGNGELTLSGANDAAPVTGVNVRSAQGFTPARQEVMFDRRGLRAVRVDFQGEGQEVPQTRNLFTLVRGPARTLIYGEATWVNGLDSTQFQVERADPRMPRPPGDYDIVVLDTVEPSDFPQGYPDELRQAAQAGTGLFIVNGPLRGSVEDTQLIADWEETEVGPILPVNSDSATYLADPPQRDVVIMVDISGSMAEDNGGRMRTARSAMNLVLDNLRPIDTISILPFQTGVDQSFSYRPATATTIAQARALIDGLRPGGGTDPTAAIAAAAQIPSQNCAFFFVSDGDFAAPRTPPTCYTQVILTAGPRGNVNQLGWGGAPVILSAGQAATGTVFPYFEPEERTSFYREGRFVPIGYAGANIDIRLPEIGGLALSYLRPDARLVAHHGTPPPDPVVALWRGGGVTGINTGVFLSEIPASWASPGDGNDALHAILTELLSWSELDRYDIRLRDVNGQTVVGVDIVLSDDSDQRLPSTLDLSILLPDGSSVPVFLQATDVAGSFQARLDLPLTDSPQQAALRLSESGRRAQMIPLALPARSVTGPTTTQEAWVSGLMMDRIDAVSNATGGGLLPQGSDLSRVAMGEVPAQPLRMILIAVALAAFAISLWTGGARP